MVCPFVSLLGLPDIRQRLIPRYFVRNQIHTLTQKRPVPAVTSIKMKSRIDY
jgi:hypothetical protein